jgi:hypothetical protein
MKIIGAAVIACGLVVSLFLGNLLPRRIQLTSKGYPYMHAPLELDDPTGRANAEARVIAACLVILGTSFVVAARKKEDDPCPKQ